jgi:hypothetical protein
VFRTTREEEAPSLKRRGRQEGAVAAPRFGAPRRRHGHRPRGASCGATRSDGCVQRLRRRKTCSRVIIETNFLGGCRRCTLLVDRWHKSVYGQADAIASDPLDFVDEPRSLMIDGREMFSCSSLAPSGLLQPPPARTAPCRRCSLPCRGRPTASASAASRRYAFHCRIRHSCLQESKSNHAYHCLWR